MSLCEFYKNSANPQNGAEISFVSSGQATNQLKESLAGVFQIEGNKTLLNIIENADKKYPCVKAELIKHFKSRIKKIYIYTPLYNFIDDSSISTGQYCELYNKWCEENYETAHFDAVIAQKMEVDFAGQTFSMTEPLTGEIMTIVVFVAILPYSQWKEPSA